MNIAKMLINPTADSPTAGARGVVALGIAAYCAFTFDWQTNGLPLFVGVTGGIIVGLNLLNTAAKQMDR